MPRCWKFRCTPATAFRCMRKRLTIGLRAMAVLAASWLSVWDAPLAARRAATAEEAIASQRALLNQYCVTCHSQKLKTAGLMLDQLDLNQVGHDAETWEKVLLKLRTGTMPPVGRPRPDRASREAFVAALEAHLDEAAAA